MNDDDARHETLAVTRGERGQAPTPGVEDVVVLVHLSSIHSVPSTDPDTDLETLDPDADEYLYSRLSNPTRNALEHQFATLEGADHVLVFISGVATIAATVTAVVRPGDRIIAFEDLYDGAKTILTRLFADRLSVDVSFVDAINPENVMATICEGTVLTWMGTPTNPLMHLCDTGAIMAIVGEGDTVFGANSTFFNPQFQTPPSLGADMVVHGATKYLNGHSDSISGAVATDREDALEELTFLQHAGMGLMLSPFDPYLTLRGTKTLSLRMRQHETNAMGIAEFLDSHEAVTRVLYPGLESHPQHDPAARQQFGFDGMLSSELDTNLGGTVEFLGAFWELPLAVGLGGVESLTEHPATMTHSPLSQAEHDASDTSDSLLRLPMGVKHVDDLRSDLASTLSVL